MNGEYALATGPNQPRYAQIATVAAISIAPGPTGLISYKWARLNSMWRGDRPSGLLITRSATSAPIQATATLAYSPSTCSSAWNTPNSISRVAITTLNTSHTTRPGWLWVIRAKKFDHASEPA